MQIKLEDDLAASIVRDIEEMGNDAPLSLKRLWSYLSVTQIEQNCKECQVYGIALCSQHKALVLMKGV